VRSTPVALLVYDTLAGNLSQRRADAGEIDRVRRVSMRRPWI
jgi:hypothetical protein